jgi:hypothetical protein
VASVEPVEKQEPGQTERQMKRFATWIGMFAGAAAIGLLAMILNATLSDLPWRFYLWMNHLQGLSVCAIGILTALAAWKADAFIRCGDNLLLKLADRVRERRALEEAKRKEEEERA